MKLTLTHIQHYPIGGENALKVKYKDSICEITDIGRNGRTCFKRSNQTFLNVHVSEIKPLLRPMSDLYKEIDGKIGIVELAKIVGKFTSYTLYDNAIDLDGFIIKHGRFQDKARFWYKTFHGSGFGLCTHGGGSMEIDQLALFEYLFANHYDVFDLIGQNLAINKTVK